jgi:hypothetical protein
MRWSSRTSYFAAGALLWNSVPHLVIWATGRRNLTPFGPNSSPGVNLLWGAINLAGGCLLMRAADRREGAGRDPEAWLLPFEAGGLAMTAFGTLYERLRPRPTQ